MLKILFLATFVLGLSIDQNFIFFSLIIVNFNYLGYSKADQCIHGPSYWCKSIKNANECHAFKHCLQTVWTTHLSYTSKKQFEHSNTPSACSNCVHCLESDSSRCLFDKFDKEIQELKSQNIVK